MTTGIICSLYPEAELLIRRLNLKQKQLLKGFSCFSNEEESLLLVISGTGKTAAAAAVSSLLQKYACGNVILFSSCAGLKEQNAGKAYLVNRITDLETGMSFYPDLLLKCSLKEASLLSGDLALGIKRKERDTKAPYDPEELLKDPSLGRYDLYDMDASGAVSTAARFLGPHQIHVLKVVTDRGNKVDISSFRRSMHAGTEEVLSYLQAVMAFPAPCCREYPGLKQVSEEMRCSETMKAQLEQLYAYASAAGLDLQAVINQMHMEGRLPCSTREEGKKALHELAERLTA